jgi:hypothetical protein
MRELRKSPAGFATATPHSLSEDSQQNERKANNHGHFLRAAQQKRGADKQT